jgi:hypothetical protein
MIQPFVRNRSSLRSAIASAWPWLVAFGLIFSVLKSLHAEEPLAAPMLAQIPAGGALQYGKDIPVPIEFEASSKLWELLSDRDGIKTYKEIDPSGDIVSFCAFG